MIIFTLKKSTKLQKHNILGLSTATGTCFRYDVVSQVPSAKRWDRSEANEALCHSSDIRFTWNMGEGGFRGHRHIGHP